MSFVDLSRHIYKTGPHHHWYEKDEELPTVETLRRHIEPWLTAVFQSEHLNLLLGSGFSTAIVNEVGGTAKGMSRCGWDAGLSEDDRKKVEDYAKTSAKRCERGSANVEDQLRAAMQMCAGLEVIDDPRAEQWKKEIDKQLLCFFQSILATEQAIAGAEPEKRQDAENLLVPFLLSFASRVVSRERLSLFTTNYDRLIEYGGDLAGLHVLDHFVGALNPIFRSSRLNLDIHYNPPGIRGEPRYLEGVVRLYKMHGSLDWRFIDRKLRRYAIPFGASENHTDIPKSPLETVMIYPNAAKDVETIDYPYADLFRDFSAAVCRPNSALVVYGYGFGDDHVNRIIEDMLTIPSTHLVIISWDQASPTARDETNASRNRIIHFCGRTGKEAQVSLLLGSHFGNIRNLVDNYLPKPAIDTISIRKAQLLEQRGVRDEEDEKAKPKIVEPPAGDEGEDR